MIKFEWDDTKNTINYKKHLVWFEEAQTVWADLNSIEFFDPEHSELEDRFLRLGMSTQAKVLLIVFCEKNEGHSIRIISARKATEKEQKQYEKRI